MSQVAMYPRCLSMLLGVQAAQERLWCTLFAAIAAGLAMAYGYLCLSQILDPGGIRHHAALSGNLGSVPMHALVTRLFLWNGMLQAERPSTRGRTLDMSKQWALDAGSLELWTIALGELASAACVALSGFALMRYLSSRTRKSSQPQSAWMSIAPPVLGLCLAIFWSYGMIKAVKVSCKGTMYHLPCSNILPCSTDGMSPGLAGCSHDRIFSQDIIVSDSHQVLIFVFKQRQELASGILEQLTLTLHVQVGAVEGRSCWRYVWLPAAPLLFVLLGSYVKMSLEESRKGVQRLQAEMYSYKNL